MVKDLNEDDVLIAMGIIARLNNKPLEEIYKNAKQGAQMDKIEIFQDLLDNNETIINQATTNKKTSYS